MNILFIHQNFPGQFKHLAPELASDSNNKVIALTLRTNKKQIWNGVQLVPYKIQGSSTKGIHPWIIDFETKTLRAEACYRAALQLKAQGFYPDVIIAHPGWGESLFLKVVWPDARMGIYCEYYYHAEGYTLGFDSEFDVEDSADEQCRIQLKNLNNDAHFDIADQGISPTRFQAASFPKRFSAKISVIHDGINTKLLRPDERASITLNNKLTLSINDEVITFINRNLEPLRGFHIFMRALPRLLKQRPKARVVIIGANKVSYGVAPDNGKNWKENFCKEIDDQMSVQDWQRVFFVGNVSYPIFMQILQVSAVHVYLTYPFVLSWSLLEAMSISCAIVASDTKPLQEVITHGENGLLVDFFDSDALAEAVCELLADKQERIKLGSNARNFVIQHYDLHSICLPQQVNWVKSLLFDAH